ncbi:MAG: VTT domain-containing protein [Gemmatimonadota bacterium]|nr:VTT domain-containing protein [Gemmatimonadota bacterium]
MSHLLAIASPNVWSDLWAYVTLGATSIITEEIAPVVAGFAAHEHRLDLISVAISCWLGTWGAAIGLYGIGRWRTRRLMARFPRVRRALKRLLGAVRRSPWRAALAVRYAFGARLTLPIACGVARSHFIPYVIGSGISCLTWSILFTVLGWAFGETAVLLFDRVKRYELPIGLALAVVIAVIVLIVQQRSRKKTADQLIAGRLIRPEE